MRRLLIIIGVLLLGTACSSSGGGSQTAVPQGDAGPITITSLSLRGQLDAAASVSVPGHPDLDPDPEAYRHDLVLGQGAIGADPQPGQTPLELTIPITADAAGQLSSRVVSIRIQP